MSIAYQEQVQLACPACGAPFEASVWLILDAQERPAEDAALRRGELNRVTCPSCGTSGPAGAPLLYHDGAARRVIFAPAPGSAEHEWREQARDLHALLVGSIPEEQRRPYLADIDIAQDLDGVAHLLGRMARRRRGAGATERGRDGEAMGAVAPPVAPARERPEANDAPPPLLVAVEALLGADSPAELDAVLHAHPVLLDATTDRTLAQLAEVAREQRAYEVAESLHQARALLARVGASVAPAPDAEPARLSEAAVSALLQAHSAAELDAAVATYPLLLHPRSDIQIGELVEHALDEGNERLAADLEDRREALARLRATGAAPGPTLDEAIEALLVAEGEAAIAEVIDAYPVLLEEVAARALWEFAAEARASGDEELARYAVECRELLRRIREQL